MLLNIQGTLPLTIIYFPVKQEGKYNCGFSCLVFLTFNRITQIMQLCLVAVKKIGKEFKFFILDLHALLGTWGWKRKKKANPYYNVVPFGFLGLSSIL